MKKSLRFGLFCLLFHFGIESGAQEISVGVKGGISIPNLTASRSAKENPLSTGYRSILGPDVAVFAEFPVSDFFSLQPQLEYSTQGGKKSGLQAFPTPTEAAVYFALQGQPSPAYLYGNFKNETLLRYLMLPVLAKFGTSAGESPWRIYASVGPFVSLLLKAQNKTSGNSLIYQDAEGQQPLTGLSAYPFDNTMSVKNELNRFNAGVEGNLGVSYRLGSSRVFIEGGGNYGFIKIQKDAVNGANNIGSVFAMAGISFSLWNNSYD